MRIEDNIETFNSLVRRRGFIWGPSPEIYGGLAGFYSYGPAGTALKNNILSLFRTELRALEFVEVECPTIMPEIVWKASGHLERFTDPIIKCDRCGNIIRADKFLKEQLPDQKIDGLSIQQMQKIVDKNRFKCSKCDSQLKTLDTYNLMLKTTVGTETIAYLRPETATTTYLLFNRLNEDARRQYPIKVYQYGKAYRNEISPRQQVLRMRAFDQFEIQLFIGKEQEMNFNEYEEINSTKLPILDWKTQEQHVDTPSSITLEECITKKILKKPAFAYCLYIAYRLTKLLGFPDETTRFRQHSPFEMAHYADDAWDLEIKTQQYGWVEICGVHDRTDYDLKQHGSFSNNDFAIPMGTDVNVKEIPQILEIAFGPDRIIYTLLESAFNVEEDRINLQLMPYLAPIMAAVFPLVKNKEELVQLAQNVHKSLLQNKLTSFFDQAGSIGKRYRRQDELGTPFCITVDYESLEDNSVTIRLRDSMEQNRVPIPEIVDYLKKKIR